MRALLFLLAALLLAGCKTEMPHLGEPISEVEKRWELTPADTMAGRNWQRYAIWSPYRQYGYWVTFKHGKVDHISHPWRH